MKAIEKLEAHLKSRIKDIEDGKRRGRRVVGYCAGGYFPEELALACGAIPFCFIRSGDNQILRAAGSYICRWIDPFWRSQIAYLTSGKDPYYNIADLIVTPVTDNHIRAFSNTAGYYTPDKELFVFGVPHVKDQLALDYYIHGIQRLRQRLEELTGVRVTDAALKKSINLCNRERQLFRQISLLRKTRPSTVSSKDFVALNHGSFLADKEAMIEILELFLQEARNIKPQSKDAPRILLTGSTLAMGDSKVIDTIAAYGGDVVMEEFAECMRPYWFNVKDSGNLIYGLAQTYFMERVCAGWFRPGMERLDFLIKLSKDYQVKGLVWYQLMFRESYKVESYFFPDIIRKETGLNTLIIESEYDDVENGPMKTRIETFMETIGS